MNDEKWAYVTLTVVVVAFMLLIGSLVWFNHLSQVKCIEVRGVWTGTSCGWTEEVKK